ncbi:MAG: transcription antitermination factor NusB, partial [Candidatus Sulfotelmatobacter sp.]
MPVSPARAAAFDILLRVERESSYASELLHSPTYENLSGADHALTTELVMGILRWRSGLDIEIQCASTQPLAKLDLEVLIALRLALYQFRRLDRIPQHAALHESVELVKRARKRSAAPFVNAVLRKLSAVKASKPDSEEKHSSAEELSATYAHPLWLVERWVREHGLAATHQICIHNQSAPPTSIRVRDESFAASEITLARGAILSSARHVVSGDVTKTQAFRNGQITIQDEASQLVAALVTTEASGNTRILD